MFFPETVTNILRFLIPLPVAFLNGKYLIPYALNALFTKKVLSGFSTPSKFLLASNFLYSAKIQKEIFEPIASDWQEEYFEALFKKEIWKARWINVRYTYAFIVAMWQKSPIGDLFEFISKIAK